MRDALKWLSTRILWLVLFAIVLTPWVLVAQQGVELVFDAIHHNHALDVHHWSGVVIFSVCGILTAFGAVFLTDFDL